MKRTLLALVTLFFSGLSTSCVIATDIQVAWTIDGAKNNALCTQYGISKWHVEFLGPDETTVTLACDDPSWSVGPFLLAEGLYTVSVSALDANGTVIAKKSIENEYLDVLEIHIVTFTFTAADFGGTSKNTVIAWSINGTLDGTKEGPTYDTCEEVGATHVKISVNGQELAKVPCSDDKGKMSYEVSGLASTDKISVVLLSGSTEISTVNESPNVAVGGTEVFNFGFIAFKGDKQNLTGNYFFQTKYNGQVCSSASPAVDQQVTLIRTKDETPVNDEVCVVDSPTQCAPTDGATPFACPDGEQVIEDLIWGMYQLKLDGILPNSSLTTCWQTPNTYMDILVGAGNNPTITVNMNHLTTDALCK